ncbi:MAG: haloacid dehalogenase type, partial [Ilumatobacteraceae bacterium]|nr:haloacid dehalogenase type [Ilumatobacteraceae bacterium]
MTMFDETRALSFDCLGTLIDWETGILQSLQPWCAWRGVDVPRAELLELFGQAETGVQAAHPTMIYPEVLGEVLRSIAGALGVDASDDECTEFGASVGMWPAFADTAVALRRLQQHYRLIILSNIDNASFERCNRRLGVELDLIITAEDVGSYKPQMGHFDALFAGIEKLGIERKELMHVAQSLYHDIVPAKRLGIRTTHIDRQHGVPGSGATPAADVVPDLAYRSMQEFA